MNFWPLLAKGWGVVVLSRGEETWDDVTAFRRDFQVSIVIATCRADVDDGYREAQFFGLDDKTKAREDQETWS